MLRMASINNQQSKTVTVDSLENDKSSLSSLFFNKFLLSFFLSNLSSSFFQIPPPPHIQYLLHTNYYPFCLSIFIFLLLFLILLPIIFFSLLTLFPCLLTLFPYCHD
uniref:Transmembrane protein n=1 Tax=Cacopsylla melanoneura TaxID=428564 RepID=A0A8D8SBD1_9HEMI